MFKGAKDHFWKNFCCTNLSDT